MKLLMIQVTALQTKTQKDVSLSWERTYICITQIFLLYAG